MIQIRHCQFGLQLKRKICYFFANGLSSPVMLMCTHNYFLGAENTWNIFTSLSKRKKEKCWPWKLKFTKMWQKRFQSMCKQGTAERGLFFLWLVGWLVCVCWGGEWCGWCDNEEKPLSQRASWLSIRLKSFGILEVPNQTQRSSYGLSWTRQDNTN